MADSRRRGSKKRTRARQVTIVVVTVVVVGGGAAAAWAATRPADESYRTAVAGPSSVTDSLALTGTIQPVTQATVAFPMSGQVASVSVHLGQTVGVGQVLSQLNTTSLASTVSADQSAVATAQAKLASDQTSQTSVSDVSDQVTTPSASGSGKSGSSGTSSKVTSLLKGLSADQNAVRKAQQQVDAALTLVSAANKQVAATCPAVVASLNELAGSGSTSADRSASTRSSRSGSSSSETSTTDSPTSTTTPPPPSGPSPTQVTDCTTLIDQASEDEAKAATDEHALTSAVTALSGSLNKVVAAVGQSAQSSGSSGSGSGSSSGSHGSGSGSGSGSRSDSGSSGGSGSGGRSGSSGPASADQIAADQASVDAADAQLAAAQQNLAAATLVSPIAGTVADVTITAGQSASANSTTAHVVVIGPGQNEVTTAVTDTQVGTVKPGQDAQVTPDGATKPIAGKVTAIGALGTTTSGGSASYPVTISLDPTTQPLFDGSTASVAVTLGTAQAAVTVPTSAVQTFGGFSVVSRMVDGKPTITRVTLGVVGPTVTQVIGGLKAGDVVSLANISEAMPTSGNTNTRGLTGGAGARGGFGGGAGGARTTGGR